MAVDPNTSIRVEMDIQVATASLALEGAIAELSRSGGLSAALTTLCLQLHSLTSLRRQIGSATGSTLAELRSEISAAASSATALAQQAKEEASASHAADPITRAEAARQTIEHVGRQLFDDKVLDPYLQFKSKEDEEAYRKRERERNEAYDRAMARGTPEGNRLALQIEQAQVRDAGAHGANRSPNFPQIQGDLARAAADLEPQHSTATERLAQKERAAKAKPYADGGLDEAMAALTAAGVTTTEKIVGRSPHGLADGPQVMRGRGEAIGRA